jgi:hypothetical protein
MSVDVISGALGEKEVDGKGALIMVWFCPHGLTGWRCHYLRQCFIGLPCSTLGARERGWSTGGGRRFEESALLLPL